MVVMNMLDSGLRIQSLSLGLIICVHYHLLCFVYNIFINLQIAVNIRGGYKLYSTFQIFFPILMFFLTLNMNIFYFNSTFTHYFFITL